MEMCLATTQVKQIEVLGEELVIHECQGRLISRDRRTGMGSWQMCICRNIEVMPGKEDGMPKGGADPLKVEQDTHMRYMATLFLRFSFNAGL